MNNVAVFIAFPFCAAFLLAANRVDPQLENAKQIHDAAVAKADAELQKAIQKCEVEKSAADARLIKVYEEVIKRITQRGDLETANRLLDEKNALQATTFANSREIKWGPLAKGGIPDAIVISDVGDADVATDYLKFFSNPDLSSRFHDHQVAAIKADGDGIFHGPGPKNIDANYYGIYLQVEAPEINTLQLSTTEFGSLKVYLDGRPILKHDANKKNGYLAKVPLPLSRGAHVLVIRHSNEWAANWVGVRILGGNLQTADFNIH